MPPFGQGLPVNAVRPESLLNQGSPIDGIWRWPLQAANTTLPGSLVQKQWSLATNASSGTRSRRRYFSTYRGRLLPGFLAITMNDRTVPFLAFLAFLASP